MCRGLPENKAGNNSRLLIKPDRGRRGGWRDEWRSREKMWAMWRERGGGR